jgi:cephalosporin-C deacetylase-like acetyl esterase
MHALARCALLGAAALVVEAASASASPYSRGSLPPILEFVDGTPVTPSTWPARQAEIATLLQSNLYGTFPKEPAPPIRSSTVLNASTVRGFEITWWEVLFATPINDTSVVLEVVRPAVLCTPSSPCPVSLMSKEHRRWNILASQRGYVAVNYPGGDNSCSDGSACREGDSTANFKANYPQATFQLIARRAYLASRVIDFVVAALPFANPTQVAITGHSRNGKQALIAAAFDTRIAAVVESSSGAAGLAAYRVSGGEGQSERPGSSWPGPWWLPSLRDFDGNEDRLPVDGHSVVGLIAPRPLLMANAYNDQVVSTRSVEASFGEALACYAFLNASSKVRVDYRIGDHHGWEEPSRYIDWYDVTFNHTNPATCGAECVTARARQRRAERRAALERLRREVEMDEEEEAAAGTSSSSSSSSSPYPPAHWPLPGPLLHTFIWTAWAELQPTPPPMPNGTSSLAAVLWALGDAPSSGPVPDPGGSYPPASDLVYADELFLRDAQAGSTVGTVVRANAALGANVISAQLYYRTDMMKTSSSAAIPARAPPSPAGWPAVVFLGGASYNKGMEASYPVDSLDMMHALANASFVVLSYDQIGFGSRLQEGSQFYARHPAWSLLGAMVHDAMSAVDLLAFNQTSGFHPAGQPDALPPYPDVDPSKIFLAGYSVGGAAALYAAALDSRVAGVATVAGWTPYRNDTDASRSGGVRRWWELFATQPRLGYFAGEEASLPVEWDDVLSLVQPRPVHAYVSAGDRLYDAAGVGAVVQRLNAEGYSALSASSPPGVHGLDEQARTDVVGWLEQQVGWR